MIRLAGHPGGSRVWSERIVPATRNLRTRRRASRSSPECSRKFCATEGIKCGGACSVTSSVGRFGPRSVGPYTVAFLGLGVAGALTGDGDSALTAASTVASSTTAERTTSTVSTTTTIPPTTTFPPPTTTTVLATAAPLVTMPPATQAPVQGFVAPAHPTPAIAYANCTEARAAGVTPLYRGEPGYASKLDRDGDGVVCE